MTEAEFITKFKKKLLNKYHETFWYKIVDGGVGINPFDTFLVINGRPIAIEFKVEPNKLTDHQAYYLEVFEAAGGISIVLTLMNNGKIKYDTLKPCNEINAVVEEWNV